MQTRIDSKFSSSEERIQASCYTWFHNTFPDYRGLLCYNLNNSANAIQGNKNKAMGVQAGRADFTFYFKGRAYFIEMKTPKGKQQEVQKNWMIQMLNHGFEYHIIRTKEDFKTLINNITNA